jgi:cyclophilin family peptidyl-prolyl cis-trans isomerase/lysophospholipase L1-like esterase
MSCKYAMAWFFSLLAAAGAAQAEGKKPIDNIKEQALRQEKALPRVLLIGDSIMHGYAPTVKKLLEGKMDVHVPPVNCESTRLGLRELDNWLGEGTWDVIHFNWGLHDMKYMNAEGKEADPDTGARQVPPDQYGKNLRKLVERLQQTGAKLIFATTTPVPEGTGKRVKGDDIVYNRAAVGIMEANGIAVNDLHGFAMENLDRIQRPRNVHFTAEGSEVLGRRVAAEILKITGVASMEQKKMVRLKTSRGEIVIELDEKAAPATAANFTKYVESGFYDGTIFHRVIKGFMVQGGGMTADMKRKPARPPITNEASNGLKNLRGTVAMARTSDPHSATSQFFINHRDNAFLDYAGSANPGYAVFGKVVEGMDVVDAIAAVKTTVRMGMKDVPAEPVVIESAALLEDRPPGK